MDYIMCRFESLRRRSWNNRSAWGLEECESWYDISFWTNSHRFILGSDTPGVLIDILNLCVEVWKSSPDAMDTRSSKHTGMGQTLRPQEDNLLTELEVFLFLQGSFSWSTIITTEISWEICTTATVDEMPKDQLLIVVCILRRWQWASASF